MKLLLNNIFRKPRNLLILITIAVSLFLVSLKFYFTKVAANILPVAVSEVNLDFGTVFPGEELQKNFTISYVEEYEQGGITYRIIKKIKPKWPEPPVCGQGFTTREEASAYCVANPNNTNCCYPDLCPSLTPIKIEEGTEEENPTLAYVGSDDLSDAWIIYFRVPAIVGHVAQEHIGEVVTSNGEYGCDVSIDILE